VSEEMKPKTPCNHCWLCLHEGISHISQVLAKTTNSRLFWLNVLIKAGLYWI